MQSTFSGLEIGKRSLQAHSRALETIGHNLANASTEGYSRQRVELSPTAPIYRPQLNRAETPGQIGQGVDIARIERVRDMLLERRIVAAGGDEAYWRTRDRYVLMLEQVYNEPSENSLRTLVDQFWDGWQELSLYPEQMASRQAVLQRGLAVAEGVQLRHKSLHQVQTMLEEEVRGTVNQINALTTDIADLNREIVNVKAAGDNPNDLMDRRDLLVQRLSGLTDVTIDDRDPDEFSVHTAGFHIVQGRIARPFGIEADRDNAGLSRVTWEHSGETAHFRGGKLAALLELRDGDVRGEMQSLDTFAVNVMDLVNEVHRSAYGLNGRTGQDFFVEHPAILNAQGNLDRNLDGQFDASYLFRITGSNTLQPKDHVGLAGTITLSAPQQAGGTVTVAYRPTDTVEDVIRRINQSGAEVTARLNRAGLLELKATAAADVENPDFVLRHVEDSGQFLVGYAGLLGGSGAAGALRHAVPDAYLSLRGSAANGTLAPNGGAAAFAVAPLANPSGWMTVNPALVREPASIAAAFSVAGNDGELGDGRAALAIAGLRNQPVGIGRAERLDDYFADAVARVGLRGEEAGRALSTHEQILKNLTDLRDSISGVSIDEELAQMIKFQHGYQAAARFVTVVDRMLETIVTRLGA